MASKWISKIDLPLIVTAIFLISLSILVLASSGGNLLNRQLIWAAVALPLIMGLPFLNLKAILSYKWVIYGIYGLVVLQLILTYFIAPEINGVRSWIYLGSFQIQPSEFMKAALILFFSTFFALRHVAIARLGIIFKSFTYFLIPAILVLIQPDLGTTLVLFGIWFGYLLLSEIRSHHLLAAFLIFIVVGAVGWNFLLADYQKARIGALFSPDVDPLGVNYSVIQSKIAIGSGGIFGKGFGQGTQVHLGFLPEAHTDFIFSAFVEEWGLFGGLILLGAFAFLVYRLVIMGRESNSNFARFVALGTALMLVIHLTINLGSATGLLPVIGVGFPLLSHGGSNLLTVAVLLGVVQGVVDKKARA